jgi:flavin reductase (DIM6/NTAB) family NADH-FMN oxidoreductase RutF
MEFSTETTAWQSIYKIMIGAIVPRPIGWVSSIDAQGHHNIAPFSFFNAVCPNPPHLLFCPAIRSSDGQSKDTLRNVRETGEFVVNLVSYNLAEAMNQTAGEYPPDVDEFALANIRTAPSVAVKPLRVADSLVHFECHVTQIVDIGNTTGAGSIVIGRIVHIHVNDSVLYGGDKIDPLKLQPIARLGGNAYTRVTADTVFEIARPTRSKE